MVAGQGGVGDGRERPRPWAFPAAAAAAVTATASLALFLGARSATPVAQDVGNLGQLLASTVAGLGCVNAARRGGPERRAWLLLASAMFIWAAAALLWFWWGITRGVYPFPSLADIGFIGYAVPAAAALFAFPRDPQPLVSRTRSIIDGLLIAVATFFVSAETVLAPLARNAGEGLAAFTALAYPVADVLIASLVLVLGLRRPSYDRWMWVLVGGGLLVLSVTDSIFVSLLTTGQPTIGTPLQAGWVASFLLIALATMIPVRDGPHRTRHFTVGREVLPYLPVLAAIIGMTLRDRPLTPSEPFLFWNGALLLGLVALHQVVLAVEKTALADDLETGVQARTSELVAARNEALEASQAKSDFVATMSHEIRTPLNGVIGLTGLILDGELGPKQRQYAEGVQRAGSALLTVISDILDFSKAEAGKVELETIDFDIAQVVHEAAELVAEEAHRKDVELLAYCAPDIPSAVRGDPSRVRQVLLNLAANAVKFTDHGEVVVRAQVVEESTEEVLVRFEVADTGIGIGLADRQRLFEPFSQADSTTTRRFGGTGLGLAISRQLVSAMGGTLGVGGEPGTGSTFWFTLPFGTKVDASSTAPHDDGDLVGLRVLVVDDNSTNRQVLSGQLENWGMRPETVEDGRAALELLAEGVTGSDPYAVVLLDLRMPTMDGLEVARRINAEHYLPGTPLVLLSSDPTVTDEEARAAGIYTTLSKPLRLCSLYGALEECLVVSRPGAAEVPRPASDAPRGSLGHVLVVEDNRVNQMVAGGMLHKLGYTSELADDGVEALAALDRSSFSAVLMDCQMPRMDGYETTRAIRGRADGSARIPVIAMTASATEEERDKCLTAGMDDFVAKPVDPQVLANTLARWRLAAVAGGGSPPQDPPLSEVLDRSRLATLAALTPGDTALLDRLVASWLDSAPEALHRIREAISAGSPEQLVQAAHRLKGSAGTLGAPRVAAACAELELLADSGDLEGALGIADRLAKELALASAALRTDLLAGDA